MHAPARFCHRFLSIRLGGGDYEMLINMRVFPLQRQSRIGANRHIIWQMKGRGLLAKKLQ
jgi:hypothetical protein